MIHCPRCGAEIPPGDVFCGKCGTRIPALSQESPRGFNRLHLKKAALPLGAIAVVTMLALAILPGEQDPCRGVVCNVECSGTALWKMKCEEGECVLDYLLESDSEECGALRVEDLCRDVVCNDECFGTTLWKMKCVEGECMQAVIIERNSAKCGYTPPTSPPSQPVILVEICSFHYDAAGDDNYNLNGEWVVICNKGDQDVDMSGWILYDEAYREGKVRDHIFSFPRGFVLRAGQSVTIYSGSGIDTASSLYWGRVEGKYGAIWTNKGDCAYLVDKQGNLIDTYCW